MRLGWTPEQKEEYKQACIELYRANTDKPYDHERWKTAIQRCKDLMDQIPLIGA